MRLASPWALLLLLLVPLLGVLLARRRRPALGFPLVEYVHAHLRSWRQRLCWVPGALRMAAVVLVIVALARPRKGTEELRDHSRGIAIQMVVDRSGSMGLEMQDGDGYRTRLDIAKDAFRDFVLGNPEAGLEGRTGDLVGMIAFARYADTMCPLTLAHGALDKFLDSTHVVDRKEEDGTAIGDALALAAARLRTAEDVLRKQRADRTDAYEIKSKVIVLLTDGENNAGTRSILEAAELAAGWGIRVYTVAVVGQGTRVVQTPNGLTRVRSRSRGADIDALEKLAELTGGESFEADDGHGLVTVYRKIDRLEKSDFSTTRYVDYRERFAAFALWALGFVLLETVLRSTVFRRVP